MKIPKFRKGDVIWIKWEDHYHNYTAGWQSAEDREKAGGYGPIYIETVGLVVNDDGQRVALSPSFAAEDDMSNGGWGVKMKKCITDYKILKKAKVK